MFQINYGISPMQMRFLRLLSKRASQNITYHCFNSRAWENEDSGRTIKVKGDNELELMKSQGTTTMVLRNDCEVNKNVGNRKGSSISCYQHYNQHCCHDHYYKNHHLRHLCHYHSVYIHLLSCGFLMHNWLNAREYEARERIPVPWNNSYILCVFTSRAIGPVASQWLHFSWPQDGPIGCVL